MENAAYIATSTDERLGSVSRLPRRADKHYSLSPPRACVAVSTAQREQQEKDVV